MPYLLEESFHQPFWMKAKVSNEIKCLNKFSESQKKPEMPYFDFIKQYLKIDRLYESDRFYELCGWVSNDFPLFSWDFNEMVCLSSKKDFSQDRNVLLYGKPEENQNDCRELRALIVRYAGEQQNK